MKIAIATLFQNSSWIVPDYLQCLQNLDTEGHEISLVWTDDLSSDNTVSLLNDFKNKTTEKYTSITLNTANTPATNSKVSRMAYLRNEHLRIAKEQGNDAVLFLDSDILLLSNALQLMIAQQVPYVSLLVYTDGFVRWNYPDNRYYNAGYFVQGVYKNLQTGLQTPDESLIPVQCSGGIYLLNKEAIQSTAQFADSIYGEDIALCQQLEALNIPRYMLTHRHAVHVKEMKQLAEARESLGLSAPTDAPAKSKVYTKADKYADATVMTPQGK